MIEKVTNVFLAVDTLVDPISYLTRLIQALGGIIVLYILLGIINAVINWKRNNEIKKLRNDVGEIKRILSKREKKK